MRVEAVSQAFSFNHALSINPDLNIDLGIEALTDLKLETGVLTCVGPGLVTGLQRDASMARDGEQVPASQWLGAWSQDRRGLGLGLGLILGLYIGFYFAMNIGPAWNLTSSLISRGGMLWGLWGCKIKNFTEQ